MRRQWRLDGIARKLRCRQLLTVPLNTGDDLVRQSAVGHRACARSGKRERARCLHRSPLACTHKSFDFNGIIGGYDFSFQYFRMLPHGQGCGDA